MMEMYINEQPIAWPQNQAPSLYPQENLVRQSKLVGDFSFFSRPVTNTIPSQILNVKQIYDLITSDKYATTTRILRGIYDKDHARAFKARNLDYSTFSGVFIKRSEAGLVRHSNLLTIDFDHIPRHWVLKEKLINNPYFETVLCFTSPSGDGLKWIVKIDVTENSHLDWFKSIQNYLKACYNMPIDKSGKDVSRCCFLPYDPDCYLNPKYKI